MLCSDMLLQCLHDMLTSPLHLLFSVHVHFGMSGAWALFNSLSEEPDVKPTTRLRLEETTINNKRYITHLSAMTVQSGTSSLYWDKKAALGADPLRSDADVDLLYDKVSKSKKSIAQLIMDQSYFTGPGNIYRAEILFLGGVYPTTKGVDLDRATFDRIWDVTVKLLRRGYDTGSILTVDADLDPEAAARGERRYIYNKSNCVRCGGRVNSWDISGRTCYACEGGCQPKIKAESNVVVKEEAGEKKKVATDKKAQKQHTPFISHCAPITLQQRLDNGGAEQLTIAEIRTVLEEMSVVDLPPKSARKSVHVDALNEALKQKGTQKKTRKEKASKPLPPPRVSAEDAAKEKAISGENRAVEHVAELSSGQAIKAVSTITPSPVAAKKVSKRKGSVKSSPTKKRSSRRKLKYDA